MRVEQTLVLLADMAAPGSYTIVATVEIEDDENPDDNRVEATVVSAEPLDMKIRLSVLFIFALLLPTLTAGEPQTVRKDSATVYICTGPKSKRFHANSNCRGLKRCSGDVVSISMEKARKQGYSPCKICYR